MSPLSARGIVESVRILFPKDIFSPMENFEFLSYGLHYNHFEDFIVFVKELGKHG